MATERVDCRVPREGLTGALPLEVSGIDSRTFSFSSSVLTACFVVGEAGIVLSLLLTSPTPAARREDIVGFAVGRVGFVGDRVLALPTDFLSEIVVG
jgi:hypothetical protein